MKDVLLGVFVSTLTFSMFLKQDRRNYSSPGVMVSGYPLDPSTKMYTRAAKFAVSKSEWEFHMGQPTTVANEAKLVIGLLDVETH